MAETTTRTAATTREKILDAAELLFIERGYSATSLRSIANGAQVNLAATHYHFGSKLGLFAAVFHRRIGPVDEARKAALDELEASGDRMDVRAIVRAFLSPFFRVDRSELLMILPGLVGRIYGEPEAIVKPLLEEEFGEVARRYQQALARALPEVDQIELRWRFHFMIGSMIQLLRFRAPLGMAATEQELTPSLERLVDFMVAGLHQNTETAIQEAS